MIAAHQKNRAGLRGVIAITMFMLASYSGIAFGKDIKVQLKGEQEVPPVNTAASGGGTITINPDKSVSGSVVTNGVVATMAHIHQAAAGKNGPVIVPLTKSGDSTWSVPSGVKLTDEQYAAYQAGGLYVNVHSDQNKGGEVRAQLTP